MSKIAAVTGANSGIGKEIARGLLEAGYDVLMLCRNQLKAEAAKAWLTKVTGRSNIDIVIVDLSSLKDIVRVSQDLTEQYSHLNVLVNNAGLYTNHYKESKDGYELTFAVNHLAVQLLTQQLLPLLEVGSKSEAARVVNVASEAHRRGKINWSNINLKGAYGSMAAYSQSKMANILHSLHCSKAFKAHNILFNACHPGVVATNFASGEGGALGVLFKLFKWAMISPEKGAQTPLFLATEPLPEPNTGRYYDKCKPKRPKALASDEDAASRLFVLSDQLIQNALKAN